MYKVLNIEGKEFHLEYSIEASLYADCVSSLTSLMVEIETASSEKNIKDVLKGVSNIPQTALVLFYAGLMDAHGDHPDGDRTVRSMQDSKHILSAYLKEHKDDGTGNFYSVLEMCIQQMTEDDFFNLVGLSAMIAQKSKTRKMPQDHKRPSEK